VYQTGGTPPGGSNWGCEATGTSKYVASIATDDNGMVTATVTGISVDVDGSVVTLVPMANGATPASTVGNANMGQGLFGWRCGATVDGTSVSAKYLPGSCRGT
jgi:type IV pilus assembly protein PilA